MQRIWDSLPSIAFRSAPHWVGKEVYPYTSFAASTPHKSGISVRFPRILRWRKDKPAAKNEALRAPFPRRG
ncbi:MAG: hypothetical protein DCF21_09940 [Leptolyngbya sp.]|uniref:DNA ligase (ATP) n=1 Tax=Shackletoniella antarctica TaxID=268115 RepID=A0A2W4W0Q2_9CYAN|nr:MAG: hypothetical protein DCF17_15000 [Shackletoniella antarctica]PZV17072.1 MAG: hypothetical protein DCF21_09940 [Leptolyngbya sp.]